MDDGYDLLAVRIPAGTDINGAIVALCPVAGYDPLAVRIQRGAMAAALDQSLAEINRILSATIGADVQVVPADVCIPGPPVP